MSDDDEIELPVPMGRETRRRLKVFAANVGKTPAKAAADLFRDLLADDDFWVESNAASDAIVAESPTTETSDGQPLRVH
jgi:hypothetical protein